MPKIYSEEFKASALELLDSGMTQKQVCQDLGISKSSLHLTRATFSRFGFSWLWIGLFPGFGVSADRTNRMLERCGSGG